MTTKNENVISKAIGDLEAVAYEITSVEDAHSLVLGAVLKLRERLPATSLKTNNHIVVGEGRRCLCGEYLGQPINCQEVIAALNRMEDYAQSETNPSLFVRKGDVNPPRPPTPQELFLICEVVKPLILDCV